MPPTGAGLGAPYTSGGGTSVAFDAASNITPWVNTISSPQTWTHTPVGTPTAVAVCAENYNPSTGGTSISSVSYGGTSMGSPAVTQTVYAGNGILAIWVLANPPSGAQTVSVALNDGVGTNYGRAVAVTVTGSNTSTAIDSSNSATGTGTAISAAVTSITGELALDCATPNTATDTATASGSQTSVYSPVGGVFSSYLAASASSTTMAWTLSPSDTWWTNLISFKHQ